jgi:hypothetical protein
MTSPVGGSPAGGGSFRMVPCTIASLSPLTATLVTGDTLPGLGLADATYSVGAQAIALWTPPNSPVFLLIGT